MDTPASALDAARLMDITANTMFQEADLLAEAIGIKPCIFAPNIMIGDLLLHPYREAYDHWLEKKGHTEEHNSERAWLVRRGALRALETFSDIDHERYKGMPEDLRYALAVAASIGAAGLACRDVVSIMDPNEKGFGNPAKCLNERILYANMRLATARGLFEKALVKNFDSWLSVDPEVTNGQNLCDIQRAALDIEKNRVTAFIDPSKAYERLLRAAFAHRGAGRMKEAAGSFIHAGSLGRFVPGVPGADVLTSYEKGVEILLTIPQEEVRGLAANIWDDYEDLSRRYQSQPELYQRVGELEEKLLNFKQPRQFPR
jgi:hypothetical protein